MGPYGGGSVVAVFVLEALKREYDVTLLTWENVDVAAARVYYGAPLQDGDFEVVQAPARLRRWVARLPIRAEQLKLGLLMRAARQLLGERAFDAVIGTDNEADFGRRAVQYVHYPWFKLPRPESDLRWIHRIPGLLATYRFATTRLLGVSIARVKKNLTLANSRFVADAIQSAHGVEARAVHPPVPGGFPLVPWDKRQNRVVGIGGFRRDKRWRDAFDVVKQVRERGHDIGLSLIGYRQSPPDWLNELIELQREHASWFKLHVDVPRTELVQIVAASKFGIHCMREEHFGIAVAELVRAGCIPFVHDSGGPPEIVAGEAALRFRSTADAVDRMDAVLRQESLQLRLREALSEHGRQFGVEGFMSSIREIVAQFIADSEGRPGSPAEVQ